MRITRDQINAVENQWLNHMICETADSNLLSMNIDEDYVDISVIINGQEVDVLKWMKFVGAQFDKMVEDEARDQIDSLIDANIIQTSVSELVMEMLKRK